MHLSVFIGQHPKAGEGIWEYRHWGDTFISDTVLACSAWYREGGLIYPSTVALSNNEPRYN